MNVVPCFIQEHTLAFFFLITSISPKIHLKWLCCAHACTHTIPCNPEGTEQCSDGGISLSLFIWMCDCLPWHRCLMLHLRKHEMRSVYWASCGAQQTEYSEISFSFKPANAHSKQCSKGLRRDGSSIIPNLNRGEKEKRFHYDCFFYHRNFSHCLSACLSDLSLPQPLLSIPLS